MKLHFEDVIECIFLEFDAKIFISIYSWEKLVQKDKYSSKAWSKM